MSVLKRETLYLSVRVATRNSVCIIRQWQFGRTEPSYTGKQSDSFHAVQLKLSICVINAIPKCPRVELECNLLLSAMHHMKNCQNTSA